MSFTEEFKNCIKSKIKCIWIKTNEELKTIEKIINTIMKVNASMNINIWEDGFAKLKTVNKLNIYNYNSVIDMSVQEIYMKIQEDMENYESTAYILKDHNYFLKDHGIMRCIKEIYEIDSKKHTTYCPIIILSSTLDIPLELEKIFTVIEMDMFDKKSIKNMISGFVQRMEKANEKYLNNNAEIKFPNIPDINTINRCVSLAYGLTAREIEEKCVLSLNKFKTIDERIFYEARKELIKKTGILDLKEPQYTIKDMGGNNTFKEWINDIQFTFSDEAIAFGVDKSKGYLALGIPGTSKSLSAEIVANTLQLPLIKINMSKIMHSHVGQSEKNMSNTLDIIKACSPCVLFIDEIEKTLSGTGSSNQTDGGTLMRVVGQLLEFLSDKDSKDIFTIMTSNDVSQIPPELIRSGRLDTIWYFGLPSKEERKEIFKIHFNLKNKEVSEDILEKCAIMTENYTGAEIKEIVKVSIRKAFIRLKTQNDNNFKISLIDINNAIKEIIPIYKSSKEEIEYLEDYAKNKARYTNENEQEKNKEKAYKEKFITLNKKIVE